MKSWLSPIEGPAYSAFRFMFGFAFMFHGLQKIFGMFGGHSQVLLSQLGLAGVLELTGGTLVMVGLFTPYVAFILCGQMAVAYFQAHFPRGTLPVQNGGELAFLYCWAFLHIAAHGGGTFSLDAMIWGSRESAPRSATARA